MPVFKTHNILSNVFHVQYSMAKEATSGVICKFKRDFCSETYYGERLVNGFKALTIFEKNSISDIRLGCKYVSELPQVWWFYSFEI